MSVTLFTVTSENLLPWMKGDNLSEEPIFPKYGSSMFSPVCSKENEGFSF